MPRLRRRLFLAGTAGFGAWAAAGAIPRGALGAPGLPGPGPEAGGVDIHCHTFSTADLPIVGFVAHHIPGLPEVSRLVSRWPELVVRTMLGAVARLPTAAAPSGEEELDALRVSLARAEQGEKGRIAGVPPLPPGTLDRLLAALLERIPISFPPEMRRMFARHLEGLYLAAHPRAAIAASLAEAHPTVELFTPALVDYDAWSEDRAPTSLATQIRIQEAISRLSIAGRIGRSSARFHPFVAFDPRREVEEKGAALALVRQAIEGGAFVGVKLYPPVGFAPSDNARLRPGEPLAPRIDQALRALYRYCQAEEVPITTHASAANEYALGLRELSAPRRWLDVLREVPSLRLNFGHFGHDQGMGGADPAAAWMHQAAELIERYPNVYADLSSSPLVYDRDYAGRLVTALRETMARHPKLKRRLMYGSDWWLNVLEPGAARVVPRFRETFAAILNGEELAGLMGRNALRFLGLLDDGDRPRDGKAAARLRRFYGSATRPPWLPAPAVTPTRVL